VLGEADSDPSGDKANHNQIGYPTAIDPIDPSSPESDSDYGREIYMVAQGDQPAEKTTEKIAREAEEELTRMTWLARETDKGKSDNSCQEDSESSEGEAGDGAPSRRHHPKFNQRRLAGRDRLRDCSRSIHEELDRIKYQGEQVYHTPAHNALPSRMIINQLTPLLPKDSEEVNPQVKRLQTMLDAATMVDPTLKRGDGGWGQDPDHHQSPRGDSAVVSLPQRSAAKSEIRIIGICTTLSATRMHVTGLKTDAKSETVSSTNDAMKGIMNIMAPSTINFTDTIRRRTQ
jgi:hypothetical protein